MSDKWETREPGINLDRFETLNYIEETVPFEKRADFKVILKRFYENSYGGNIVIGQDGSVMVELTPGLHLNLVRGVKTPTIIARSDPFTGRMNYFKVLEDKTWKLRSKKMKETIWKTLECIPKDYETESGKRSYYKGYYEFILYERGEELLPLYLDYRDSGKYQLDNSSSLWDANREQSEGIGYRNESFKSIELKKIDKLLARFKALAKNKLERRK